MNDVKVSIIMPVYKVENYVGKAIESMQKQTLTDWEFLIVDDGSPDKSGEICDEYAKHDGRLRVIHKENGGAPSARNIAIDLAKGKYMYFLDSDDWAEPTMLEDMVNLAEKHGLELVVSGYYIDTYYNETEKFTQEQFADAQVYSSQAEFRRDAHRLFDKNLLYTPWNKLYLSKYILDNQLYFPQTFWDDFPFNLSVIRNVEKVGVLSDKYYHFIRQRTESETAKYRSDMYDKREEEHRWMLDLYAYWNEMSPDIEEFLCRRYIERVIGCIENVTNKNCDLPTKEKKMMIKRMITDSKAVKAAQIAQPKSSYMKILLCPIKWKNTSLAYLESRFISFVKSRNTKMFAKLKAGR